MHSQTTIIDLNPSEIPKYPFITGLDRCNESCNTVEDPNSVLNKMKDVNLKVFDMVKGIN